MADVESFKCKLVSYDEITKWCSDVADKIRDIGYMPEVVVGLTRGGWVPARILCDELFVKKLYAVKTEHWGVTANPDGNALLTQELITDVTGERVLVIDDITDTGASLKLAVDHVKQKNPAEVMSASLIHIERSEYVPDVYSYSISGNDWTWFIFPWNVHEDMRTILPKTLYEPKNNKEIQNAFIEQFQIEPSATLISKTLRDLERLGKVKENNGLWELQ
ncbi:phosphoribosyltransferase [Candidatus Methanomassiliicoccus intestinalis]|jgi:phosphoribosyl transferase domain protein|uniref:Phosphoribosyltransferase n=2 Tax=Candidatus Methanomassiliicoccus intestinalis TaxID=1406512 RepID=R9T879_METII|nr:phosphoribosyltransferase [Candidatus Methanomassiliicoccus intestinalis]AGN25851.1 phosphoribosyltransferase [Candidatus Methanomassiliicoccus intestinalis Issoire-Mx1]TQS81181.1 MAG: phosphoribosyltransferase [Candidatus Methanomassiliicoccus intestinalis]TQS83269.1 MAG: phosphoribosyltransferase [Candidatus Methanomassiliicoccus intestinalis]